MSTIQLAIEKIQEAYVEEKVEKKSSGKVELEAKEKTQKSRAKANDESEPIYKEIKNIEGSENDAKNDALATHQRRRASQLKLNETSPPMPTSLFLYIKNI